MWRSVWRESLSFYAVVETVNYIGIRQWSTNSSSLQFNEEVIGAYLRRVGSANIGHDPIDEFGRYINCAWSMYRLDRGPIFKLTAITDMNTVLRDINILHPESQCFVVSSDDSYSSLIKR